MFRNNDQTMPQFVCSTQPLALLLSRDSILCFDGDAYGLYFPWRGSSQGGALADPELARYLEKQGAYEVPAIAEQKRLISLFFDNIYPFYPIVPRRIAEAPGLVPLLLLNAVFLAAVRFDTQIPSPQIRSRLAELFRRCKLLDLAETNKVVLIQAFLLLSIHEEGMEGVTSSKQYVSRATNLCGELAITNMGGTLGSLDLDVENGPKYLRPLLSRIFWCAFCVDRMVSATSGREMIFNRKDLLVDEIQESDFEGPTQKDDFAVFSAWLHICELIERIQCSCYRPPQNRSIDPELSDDLSRWRPPVIELEHYWKCGVFLQIASIYCRMLHLRSAIDSTSLVLGESIETAPNSIFGQIHACSTQAIRLVDPLCTQNVLVVHVVLHVIALLQLECKLNAGALEKSEFLEYYHMVSRESLAKLAHLRDYWWFAGTALLLCENVFEMGEKS